jgi:nucleoside-diphosphate-sugar epimerase
MRVALTGGSGFVGRVLARVLVDEGHELVSLCRDPSSICVGSTLLWDMGCRGTPPLSHEPIDAVAHLAQARNYRRFPEDAIEMFEVNVAATAALLNWALASGAKRFILVSSGTVYEPFAGALDEGAPLAPSSYLGASKLAAEVIARPFASKMELCILRVFFPYGPAQTDRLIPHLVTRICSGRAVTLAGTDGLVFTPTLVDDVADVIARALGEGWTGTFNLAAPRSVTIRAVADQLGQLLGVAPRFESLAQIAPNIVPSLQRLASHYDLERFTPFEEGLRRTIKPA